MFIFMHLIVTKIYSYAQLFNADNVPGAFQYLGLHGFPLNTMGYEMQVQVR